jgi:hypothetical protein
LILIPELWKFLQDNSHWAGLLALVSILLLAGSILFIPGILLRLPKDYFHNPHHRPLESLLPHPVLRMILLILKNVFAILLAVAGFGMLVLPGQGVLTLLVALILLDFPGKFALKRKLISVPRIHHTANAFRKKRGKEEFQA